MLPPENIYFKSNLKVEYKVISFARYPDIIVTPTLLLSYICLLFLIINYILSLKNFGRVLETSSLQRSILKLELDLKFLKILQSSS